MCEIMTSLVIDYFMANFTHQIISCLLILCPIIYTILFLVAAHTQSVSPLLRVEAVASPCRWSNPVLGCHTTRSPLIPRTTGISTRQPLSIPTPATRGPTHPASTPCKTTGESSKARRSTRMWAATLNKFLWWESYLSPSLL